MISKVLKFIEKYQLLNKTILVGFSGGFDSMCLLDILWKINVRIAFENRDKPDPQKLKLVACHYNHNWRGDEAKQEQENCEKFCKERGIEFYTETAPDNIKKNETEARELRYAFFERAIEKYGADALFTAHNYDDNAETILYRVIKGTGVVGLKGILPNRGKFYRPLLSITREEIEKYCTENNLCPNDDSSNSHRIHKRNLIRHDILPLLSEINPDVKNALNSLGMIAQSESDIVDEYIAKISEKLFDGEAIKTQEYMKCSNAVKQKIIYNLIYESEFDYTMDTIVNICDFIRNTLNEKKPSKFSLGKDAWIYVDKNIIEIINESVKCDTVEKVEAFGEYDFNGSMFRIEPCENFEKTNTESIACVDLSGFKELYIRTRRAGDVIQPLGCSGKMKLKKYLMSKNIPQFKRDDLILLTDEKEILWVAGVGLSDKIKTVTNPTHKVSVKYREG